MAKEVKMIVCDLNEAKKILAEHFHADEKKVSFWNYRFQIEVEEEPKEEKE